MLLSELLKRGAHAKKPPDFFKEQKRSRKRKRALTLSTAKLSKTDFLSANAVFKALGNEKTSGTSIFPFILTDLFLAFPKLPVFESQRNVRNWLYILWHDAVAADIRQTPHTIFQCDAITKRMKSLLESSEVALENGFPLSFLCDAQLIEQEILSPDAQTWRNQDFDLDSGSLPAIITKMERDIKRVKDTDLNVVSNDMKAWFPVRFGSRIYLVHRDQIDKCSVLVDRPFCQEHKAYSKGKFCELTRNPFKNFSITRLWFNRKKLKISFNEALWVIAQLQLVKKKHFLNFIKNYEETLIYSPQWKAAFCLMSAVKNSTFSTYLSNLRMFTKFLARKTQVRAIKYKNIEDVITAIKDDSLEEEEIVAFALYRLNRIKFASLRGNLTALSFFYRHIPQLCFWDRFPKLRQTIKACGHYFSEDAEGSIFLNWENMKTFLNHVYYFDITDVSKQVLFDCFLLSFWFGLRISEATNLWFKHTQLLEASQNKPERLRICVVDSKTNTWDTPWHLVTLHGFSDKLWQKWCPIKAFKRLQRRRARGQIHIFTRKNGKAFTKTWLDNTFRSYKNFFQKEYPLIIDKNDKCTFHVFRISSMGFYVRDIGLTIFETQSLCRHKLGSKTTEKIYLAKARAEFNRKAANLITKYAESKSRTKFNTQAAEMITTYIKEHNSFPSEEDCEDFMSHCNNAGMAKRFKTFHKKPEKPQPKAFSPLPSFIERDNFFKFQGPRKTL